MALVAGAGRRCYLYCVLGRSFLYAMRSFLYATGGEVGRKIFPPFGDCSGMSRGLSLDGGAGAQ